MFDFDVGKLVVIGVVALVVIGPKDLPRALYKVGQVVGKARAMSRHFRSGIDAMMREAEMEELQKKWAEENRRIMEQYPNADALPDDAPVEPEFDETTIIGNKPSASEVEAPQLPLPTPEKPA